FAIQDKTGRLTPAQLKLLYSARVDCHLTHACEVVPDAIDAHIKDLEKVQAWFIRRSLRVGKKASAVALYTETGLMPLRVRRFLLLLRYLEYLLNLDAHHYAHLALESSKSLYFAGKASWYGDVITASDRLPFDARSLPVLADAKEIAVYATEVEKMAEKWLLECLNGTKKLYLTHGRLDTVRKGKPPKEVALKLRVYLTCPVSSYRDALASVVFSTHKLAVERLRWVDHGRPTVARHCRLCRLCEGAVETPEHALL
ncbi:hypothetical protein ARMSODRAFT_852415, partial [Armillaria solidipes]